MGEPAQNAPPAGQFQYLDIFFDARLLAGQYLAGSCARALRRRCKRL
jgi:hypothetical protein